MRAVGAMLALALSAAAAAGDKPPEVARMVPAAELRGAAEVSFLSFPLYRAQLWTPDGSALPRADSFALSLMYERGFTAQSLARASVGEVARIEGRQVSDFADLEALLRGCFADVSAGDRITGISDGPDSAVFFVNGLLSCTITYTRLRDRFFGIWLGGKSRDARVTAELRGEG